MIIYERKFTVHEVHILGEETFSKKKGLEEIYVDSPKPPEQATQRINIGLMFILLSKLIAMDFEWLGLLQNLVAIMCALAK